MSLGLDTPLIAAPMAGGPSTPALVTAAARAGGLGFLAAGYRTPEDLGEQIAAVRAAGVPFGVNLFAPNPVPVDPAAYGRYRAALHGEADRYGVLLPESPREDDDHWHAKVELLLADPVPVVSFTFGVPDARVIAAFRKAGTLTVQTVTTVDEAKLAGGVDALVVQGAAAGAHYGTLTPSRPAPPMPLTALVSAVRAATGQPVLAAGGLATADAVAAVLHAGAEAAVVGTALLLANESGTSAPYRTALAAAARAAGGFAGAAGGFAGAAGGSAGAAGGSAGAAGGSAGAAGGSAGSSGDAATGGSAGAGGAGSARSADGADGDTVVTRAFSGRPARALRNAFVDRYDAIAPAGYPAIHHLTAPLRRAATANHDPDRINLWAGTGYRHARAEPLAATFARLYQATGA
jgi:NAD(P)H-dependent flavin oxidoreductase YrpB (nitropropane dioxygenase family)